MDLFEHVEQLTADRALPVYLVHGPERFLADLLVRKLKALLVAGPMADLNYRRLKAAELGGAGLVAEARSLPMLAPKRLLVVEDCDGLKVDDWTTLEAYLEQPVPETCLVLLAASFDARRGPIQRAGKRGQLFKTEPLKEAALPAFIKGRLAARGHRWSAGAIAELVALVGADAALLDDAIERVTLFCGPDRAPGAEDVAEVVAASRQHPVFDLVDAIGGRDERKALELTGELLARREEPLRLLALLARHLRQLIGARVHHHQRTDEATIARLIGAPPFAVRKLVAQSQRFASGAELETALARLARADLELKSSRRPAGLILEEAVMDLCAGGSGKLSSRA